MRYFGMILNTNSEEIKKNVKGELRNFGYMGPIVGM